MHEASLYPQNSFLTLTYSDENLPKNSSLDKKHVQDFMKRLREAIEPRRIRYLVGGEYGDQKGMRTVNPHYHVCLFNYDFSDDRIESEQNERGDQLYESEQLTRLWKHGKANIGALTFESAAYVARYVMKKMTGPLAVLYYSEQDDEGNIFQRVPEFALRSQGLGRGWFEKFKADLYPDDFALIKRGSKYVKVRVPKYYDALLEREDPQLLLQIKAKRKVGAAKNKEDLTFERLAVREEFAHLKYLNSTRRKLDL